VLACSLVAACEYALSSIPRFLNLRGSKPKGAAQGHDDQPDAPSTMLHHGSLNGFYRIS